MDYNDFINKYTQGKRIKQEDKDTFFSSMLNYFHLEDLKTLWHVVTHLDCAKTVFSAMDISLIIGGIIYVVIPLDAMPDFIPGIGLLDDIAVLNFVLSRLQDKLEEYRLTCMENNEGPDDNPQEPNVEAILSQ